MKPYLTVQQFCAKHDACKGGREWAVANCPTMQDAWTTAKPEWVIWIATRAGVLNDRDLRLFAVFCARSCLTENADPRSVAAIDCAERFAKGEAIAKELSAARSAAQSAAWSAAAWSAESAARSAAESAQATWLRNNTIPNFDA